MPVYEELPDTIPYSKSKKLSEWHFDYTKPPEPGSDSFWHVCRFDYDFRDAIERSKKGEVSTNFKYKNISGDVKKDWKLFTSTEKDMLRMGGDPYHTHFNMHEQQEPIFKTIAEDHLGIENYLMKFNMQLPTQILPVHFDTFDLLSREIPDVYEGYDVYANWDKLARFAIMLDDWKLGQFFQIGNATFHQWRAGDCITWRWKDMPH
jgi:hypothetical protein